MPSRYGCRVHAASPVRRVVGPFADRGLRLAAEGFRMSEALVTLAG
ncbi:hypothetical protein [Agromyces salentinus]|nr:hypothetical protein [Agromyces salentinus]